MKEKSIKMNNYVHFSIDDVIDTFHWIYLNQPESIFDAPMLNRLKCWHKLYGLYFDLYVFEQTEDFNLSMLQDRYWEEISQYSAWLRLGWHQITKGEILSSKDDQIASLERVYNLILNKLGKQSWSKEVRLHYFAGDERLLECIKEMGTHTLLTADSDSRISYNLTAEECQTLSKNGLHYDAKTELLYRITDLRLDYLKDSLSTEDAVEFISNAVNRDPHGDRICLFCHEVVFMEICEKAEDLLRKIPFIPKKLYINASVYKSGTLYFSDIHTNSIYKWNIKNGEPQSIVDLPEQSGMKFSSIILINNKIWMIPMMARNIYVFDTENSVTEIVDLPYRIAGDYKACGHRKVICCEEYLWLLPASINAIVRINTTNYSIKIFNNFPDKVYFGITNHMPFKCMDLYGDYLYLFADDCSHNLRVNARTGEMEIWNDDFRKVFGAVINDDEALLSPTYRGDALVFYNKGTKEKKELILPDEVWQDAKIYAFWYAQHIGKYIYVVPHEANGILKVDPIKKEVDVVSTDGYEFKSLRPNAGFSGYDVIDMEEDILITSYMGNQIIILDGDGMVKKVLDINIPFSCFHINGGFLNNIYYESDASDLGILMDSVNRNTLVHKRFDQE